MKMKNKEMDTLIILTDLCGFLSPHTWLSVLMSVIRSAHCSSAHIWDTSCTSNIPNVSKLPNLTVVQDILQTWVSLLTRKSADKRPLGETDKEAQMNAF